MRIHAASRLVEAETLNNYVNRLKKLGIKQIGDGGYGMVFQHPTLSDVVVKLLVEKDPDYLRWIKFSQKNQTNPYVPKVFNLAQDKRRFDPEMFKRLASSNLLDMHLIFMEKLEPLTKEEYEDFGTYMAALANRYLGQEWFKGGRRTLFEADSLDLWKSLSSQKEDKALAKVARFIGTAGADIDLHRGNIMKRGSQIVITDPFAS